MAATAVVANGGQCGRSQHDNGLSMLLCLLLQLCSSSYVWWRPQLLWAAAVGVAGLGMAMVCCAAECACCCGFEFVMIVRDLTSNIPKTWPYACTSRDLHMHT